MEVVEVFSQGDVKSDIIEVESAAAAAFIGLASCAAEVEELSVMIVENLLQPQVAEHTTVAVLQRANERSVIASAPSHCHVCPMLLDYDLRLL